MLCKDNLVVAYKGMPANMYMQDMKLHRRPTWLKCQHLVCAVHDIEYFCRAQTEAPQYVGKAHAQDDANGLMVLEAVYRFHLWCA